MASPDGTIFRAACPSLALFCRDSAELAPFPALVLAIRRHCH